MNDKNKLHALGLAASPAPVEAAAVSVRERTRLARSFAHLENIDRRRAGGQNSLLDAMVEKWVVWRELFALELHNIRRS